ncbi:histidine phosphatase superfamily [Sparassis latifolia]
MRNCGTDLSLGLRVPDHVQRLWGQYSPWHPVDEYVSPPKHCKVTRLHRHGARYPAKTDGVQYGGSIQHLASPHKFVESNLDFLKDYRYDMGEEDLIPFGASATSMPRVMATAGNWTVGFSAASHQRYNPNVNVVISESRNSTLQNDCPNAGEGSAEMGEWLSIFGPLIAARLNKAAPGADLNEMDIFNVMAMFPFETLATENTSPLFCRLFTDDDFRAFEYDGDVEKYYKTGYGKPLGPVQGIGYVNELLSRLSDSPVQDHTTHNFSLHYSPHQTIYADFSHDNLMVAEPSVCSIFPRMRSIRAKCLTNNGVWVASRILHHGLRSVVAFMEIQGYARRDGDSDFEKCFN